MKNTNVDILYLVMWLPLPIDGNKYFNNFRGEKRGTHLPHFAGHFMKTRDCPPNAGG